MAASIEARVGKGAALLDAKKLGWQGAVMARGFDMGQFETCLDGRLRAVDRVDLFQLCGCDAATMVAHGFDVPFRDKSDYPALTAAWKKAAAGKLVVPDDDTDDDDDDMRPEYDFSTLKERPRKGTA